MDRIGTVFTFKEEVTEDEAREALAKIVDVIEGTVFIGATVPGCRRVEDVPPIYSYNDDWGGPVWYIP